MKLGMQVGLGPGHFVLDGDPTPFLKRGESPPAQFSAHVYCGQTAAWIKMQLGTEVGLGLRDIVFDVDPATHRKKGTPTPTQFLAHVCCGHGRPSQLLLRSCNFCSNFARLSRVLILVFNLTCMVFTSSRSWKS